MRNQKQMRKKWIQFLMRFSLYTWKKKLHPKNDRVTSSHISVIRNKDFAFSKYLGLLMIMISAVYFWGCEPPPQDYSCTSDRKGEVTSLSFSPEVLQVGQECNFTATMNLCLDYKYCWLWIQGPLEGNWSNYVYDRELSALLSNTEIFPHTFTQPGKYYVYFSISKNPYDSLSNWRDLYRELNVTVVGIEMNNFKIIELSSSGDSLWQNYNSGDTIFNAGQKLNTAFNEAYTRINFIDRKKNLTIPDNFLNVFKLYEWTINNAGGTYPGTQPYGLDTDVVIISGTKNIADNTVSPQLEHNVTGFTFPRVENQMPALCWIRVDRLREIFQNPNQQYDFIRSLTGTSIHELGHAREIPESEHDIHSGTNEDKCVMHTDRNIDWDTNPRFCDYHKNKLLSVVW